MYYNERNNYENNCKKDDDFNFQKGFCSIKVIQECYYPKTWKNENKYEDNYYNETDNCYEKQKSYCDQHNKFDRYDNNNDYRDDDFDRYDKDCKKYYKDFDRCNNCNKCHKKDEEKPCNKPEKHCCFCGFFRNCRR